MNSDSTERTQITPIATYIEIRFDGKRRFELFAETIHVCGSATLQSTFDTTIPLKRMDARVVRRHVRNRNFWGGLWMAIVGFVSCTVLIAGFHLYPWGLAPGILGVIGVSGVLLSLATFRKIEFAQFDSDAGVPILTIARAGRYSDTFDDFVKRVREQICLVRDRAPQNAE